MTLTPEQIAELRDELIALPEHHPVVLTRSLARALLSAAEENARLRKALTQAAAELDEASHIIGGKVGPSAGNLFMLASERARAALEPSHE